MIDAPFVASRATRSLSAEFKDSKCSSFVEEVTSELRASQLGKLSELRVVTFQNRLKTKQMFDKSKF